jgi:hypothetical protein
VREAIYETGVPEPLVKAIMGIESQTHGQASVSPKGALGLMQLMPDTAEMMGVDPTDPAQNVLGGARYIAYLARKYNGNPELVVMGYNAGPPKTDRAIRHAKETNTPISRLPETQGYFQKMDKSMPGWRDSKVSFNNDLAIEMDKRVRGIESVKYPSKPKKATTHQHKLKNPKPVTKHVAKPTVKKKGLKEGHGAGISHGATDLSGKRFGDPDLQDAEDKNRVNESRATRVAVTIGNFQPFHRAHSAVVRALAQQAPKVIIFAKADGPFSPDTIRALIDASLSDIYTKLEIHPAKGDVQSSINSIVDTPGTTLHSNSQVSVHPMPEEDEISSKRIIEALQDDDKDQVRNMLDPLVSTAPGTFENLYGRMRKELSASGKDTVEVVTDAPVAGPRPEELAEHIKRFILAELGGGAMETGVGYTRGGAFGHSAWSGYNPRGNFDDDKEEGDDEEIPNPPKHAAPGAASDQYQNMTKSPSTRMLSLVNRGVANDHMPGDFGQHLDDEEDEEKQELEDPTDLDEMILRKLRTLK